MDLANLWFGLVAALWVGFFILDGFDLGVGALHRIVGRTQIEQRTAINTVGAFWDGNEVWLIVGGAAIFAAFPAWYAAMFSSLYLALVVLLIALIVRGVAFEWRGKGRSSAWSQTWSRGLSVSSLLIPFLLGVGLGDLLAGLPLGPEGQFTGSFWDLLTPYGLLTGLTLTLLCLVHGALFLALKTDATVRRRSQLLFMRLWPFTFMSVIGWIIATYLIAEPLTPVTIGLLVTAGGTFLGAVVLAQRRLEGWAFAATSATLAAVVASLFAALFPNVMLNTTGPALTIADTSSGDYALTVMTVVAAVMLPVVLAYQAYTYWVFRSRVRSADAPAAGEVTADHSAPEVQPGGRTDR